METNWSREARKLAFFLSFAFESVHRGAFEGPLSNCLVLFGTDGYEQDPRARREVELIREGLQSRGLPLLGFDVDPLEGRVWVMLVGVAPDDLDRECIVYELLWHSCKTAFEDLKLDRDRWSELESESESVVFAIERLWMFGFERPAPPPGDVPQAATIPHVGMIAPLQTGGPQTAQATP
jgi:hypothetical protein